MSREDELRLTAKLLGHRRWGALATVEDGSPYASAVAFAPEERFSGFLLHLSRLAPHTRNLLATGTGSLMVSEEDPGGIDPQTLGRVSLLGEVAVIEAGSGDYEPARARYLAHLPSAAPLFEFPDFQLFRLTPFEARVVGGFARARRLEPAALAEAWALL